MDEIENLWKRALNEAWNPLIIDFKKDIKDWFSFNDLQRKYLVDLFCHQILGEYEVLIGVSRLAKIINDKDARFFLLTHARDNTVHANIFERFLIEIGEEKVLQEGITERVSKPYYELLYVRPRNILEEIERKFDLKKLVSFMTYYYFAADGILYNISFIALEQLIFSKGLLGSLYEAYKRINVDEKRQTLFCAYYIKKLSEKNKEVVSVVNETLNEVTPLIISVIGYFAPLSESFGRNIEDFAGLIEEVINDELKIIGLKNK